MARRSVTPADEGCQEVMTARLAAAGFPDRATALRQRRELLGAARSRRPGVLLRRSYGRGADRPAGGMAHRPVRAPRPRRRALRARRRRHEERPGRHGDGHRGVRAPPTRTTRARIAFLITSDEEGPSVDGTKRVVETLRERGERIDWCVVGEPSSESAIGDTIKVGRRGSFSGRLTVHGVQGHVAYPQLAENPVHTFAPGSRRAHQPRSGTRARSISSPRPSRSPISTPAPARRMSSRASSRRASICATRPVQTLGRTQGDGRGHPAQARRALHASSGTCRASPSTRPRGRLSRGRERGGARGDRLRGRSSPPAAGTSDGRFIAPLGAQVVELGVVNATIHKVNESVRVADIDALHRMYFNVLRRLCWPEVARRRPRARPECAERPARRSAPRPASPARGSSS